MSKVKVSVKIALRHISGGISQQRKETKMPLKIGIVCNDA